MRVILKRPIAINGVNYAAGEHELALDVSTHWMVQGMLADGDALMLVTTSYVADPVAPVAPVSPDPAEFGEADESEAERQALIAKLKDSGARVHPNTRLDKLKAMAAQLIENKD